MRGMVGQWALDGFKLESLRKTTDSDLKCYDVHPLLLSVPGSLCLCVLTVVLNLPDKGFKWSVGCETRQYWASDYQSLSKTKRC